MFCGFTLGSALAGLVAARVLPGLGWRILLIGGGAVPLLLAPVLGALLPESVRFLVMSLLVVYLMTNWMPTLLQQASGASIAEAAFIGAMYQVGGTLGVILVGGVLLGFGWPATTVYALVAILAVVSALALATLGRVRQRGSIAAPLISR